MANKTFVFDNMSGWTDIVDDIFIIRIDGSNDFKDFWSNNFNLGLTLKRGRLWHRGFYRGWKLIEDMVFDVIRKNLGIKKVRICGTSLGGAVAGVGAYFIAREFEDLEVKAVNASGPSFLWGFGVKDYNSRVDSIKIRVGSDVVGTYPQVLGFVSIRHFLWALLFRRTGKRVYYNRKRGFSWRPKYLLLDHISKEYYDCIDSFTLYGKFCECSDS